jgi:hypothetical protein
MGIRKLAILLILLFPLFFFEKQAFAQELERSIYIRVNKSYVRAGDSYEAYVFEDYNRFIGFSGNLEVCNNYNPSTRTCNSAPTPWRDFSGNLVNVTGGKAVINIPQTATTPFTARVRFRPLGSNWGWSNEIVMAVNTTNGLLDVSTYFIMNRYPIEFNGENRAFTDQNGNTIRTPFKTVIGFMNPSLACDGTARNVMYFIKDKTKGYWDPETPWFNDLFRISKPDYARYNLLWYVKSFQKLSGWQDEFLTAEGHRTYYTEEGPLTYDNNFKRFSRQYRYTSANPAIPAYFLSARYVGNGWGLSNNKARFVVTTDPNTSLCTMTNFGGDGFWAVHADKTSLSGYPDVLRLKYYEGDNGFATDSTKYVLREDWYFAKNVGLVKIDVKNFCPTTWGTYARCKPCRLDPSGDCFAEYISDPTVTLSRVGPYYTPTPTPIIRPPNADANSDGRVDGVDYVVWLGSFDQPTSLGPSGGDFDHSGRVDNSDYLVWLDSYGGGTLEGYFTISVADESFCLYTTNPQTIQLARDNYFGLNQKHPQGPILAGSGGFNYGYGGTPGDKYYRYWSWHMDPQRTLMVDQSIELCDGLPSAVEYGPIDYGQYCPWLGKVTALNCIAL